MPATYEPIATTTLGSDSAAINFTSIPNTYTDLVVIVVGTGTGSSGRIQFNSDTGTNYSQTSLYGNGSSAASARTTSQANVGYLGYTAGISSSIPTMAKVSIFNYAGSTNKTFLVENAADQNGSGDFTAVVGLWRSTSAITAVNLIMGGTAQYKTGTTATLYGIKAA